MSFVGGGSDMPEFYRRHGGAVLSTAIDKYIYVNINQKFDGGIRLGYSKNEEVDSVDQIEHRLVRAAFECLNIKGGVEITTIADIPSRGTGLGSSSSFTVGLLNAVSAYQGRHISADDLGRMSCEIEIDRCGEPIGKQDQYAAAYGGFNLIEFKADESVLVTPVIMPRDVRTKLEESILVFYTGITRSASKILKEQSDAVVSDHAKRSTLIRMVELAYHLRDELQAGNLESFGDILHDNWNLKKTLSNGVSSAEIDDWYETGRRAGAVGGKILGAGSGGFLMFYAPPEHHSAIKQSLHMLRSCQFRFDALGSRIIFYNPTALS
ncbi:GHMP family kinase ATP-binding protein [Methylobacterium persicinum]|uniref:D-glycero-alpha-D-manno-heptose-7-phosphate kinase n=2 Tax=Pseudomonadota TaxID=1224 RepID=A0ABU0HL15_9HYPH|nr:GHMP kinase [Methylobacterium persicinum]MDQ0443013.1 D-glycero-alpha-D-manno-heptose-7-phosphate kinase [Methylobacterium persicinum]